VRSFMVSSEASGCSAQAKSSGTPMISLLRDFERGTVPTDTPVGEVGEVVVEVRGELGPARGPLRCRDRRGVAPGPALDNGQRNEERAAHGSAARGTLRRPATAVCSGAAATAALSAAWPASVIR